MHHHQNKATFAALHYRIMNFQMNSHRAQSLKCLNAWNRSRTNWDTWHSLASQILQLVISIRTWNISSRYDSLTTPTALKHLAKILDGMSIQWALMGALAANRYRSSPRLTNDIDLLLADTGAGIDELERVFILAGWSVHRADPGGELIRLKYERYGVADLLVSGTDYQCQALQHAVEETIDNEHIKVLTVEDVVIHKLIAGQYQDLADIEAILETKLTLDQE